MITWQEQVAECEPLVNVITPTCPRCKGKSAAYRAVYGLPSGEHDVMFYVQCERTECGLMTKMWYPLEAALQAWGPL